jgi:hypothetical protein
MKPLRSWTTGLACALLATGAIAQTQRNPVGTWNGTVRFIDPQKPNEIGRDSGNKARYQIVFQADKTFVRKITSPQGKSSTTTGLWSVEGNEVRLTIMKVNGNKLQRPSVSKLSYSADGKSLRLRIALSKQSGANLPRPGESPQIVYQRAK